jgi:signal transduction histidine kinase
VFTVVLASVAIPVAVTLSEPARQIGTAALVCGLVAYAVVLTASAVAYLAWRLTNARPTGWLVAGLALASVQAIAVFAFALGGTSRVPVDGWQIAMTLPTLAALAAMLLLARRHRLVSDPLLTGVTLGLVLAVARYVVTVGPPELSGGSALHVTGIAVIVAGFAAFALLLLRATALDRRVRRPLAAAVLLLGVGNIALYSSSVAVAQLSIAVHTLGAILVLHAAILLVRDAVDEDQRAFLDLERRVERVEASERIDRARMHEIGSIVAGITSASRLVQERDRLDLGRREAIEEMLDSEIARLGRLLRREPCWGPELVELDEIVRPLVVAQRAQGRSVSWRPTGHLVLISPDLLSEALSILLENAARHAHRSAVTINTRAADGRLTIRVSDNGPGIPEELRGRLFDWESRGPSSPGQGIGLHIARSVLVGAGGSLRHVAEDRAGATFEIELPVVSRMAVKHVQGSYSA